MLCKEEMKELSCGKYLLDGYQTINEPTYFKNNGKDYSLQRYQKKHKNEFVVKCSDGYCYLYRNGLLEMVYKEENGKRQGDFISLEKGRISFIQDSDNILNTSRWIRKVNDKRGELNEIWEDGKMVYRGKLNEKNKREGIGVAYDKECDVEYEGIFKNDECIQILRIFEGDEMIELLDNGNNVDVVNQIPVYVGGWKIDDDGEYARNGSGYLINENTRTAVVEIISENGVELERQYLYDGWYRHNHSHPISIPSSPFMGDIQTVVSTIQESYALRRIVANLVISSNSCNDVKSLNLNQYERLKTIEIGDRCFRSVKKFYINGLNELESLKIGEDSFSQMSRNDEWSYEGVTDRSRSFHLLNCAKLRSVVIGMYSFYEFAGGFELKNLPSLLFIKIGLLDVRSLNFCSCSFILESSRIAMLIYRSSKFRIY